MMSGTFNIAIFPPGQWGWITMFQGFDPLLLTICDQASEYGSLPAKSLTMWLGVRDSPNLAQPLCCDMPLDLVHLVR